MEQFEVIERAILAVKDVAGIEGTRLVLTEMLGDLPDVWRDPLLQFLKKRHPDLVPPEFT